MILLHLKKIPNIFTFYTNIIWLTKINLQWDFRLHIISHHLLISLIEPLEQDVPGRTDFTLSTSYYNDKYKDFSDILIHTGSEV